MRKYDTSSRPIANRQVESQVHFVRLAMISVLSGVTGLVLTLGAGLATTPVAPAATTHPVRFLQPETLITPSPAQAGQFQEPGANPTPAAPVTPPPGSVLLALTPPAAGVGWASSLDGRNHPGFPNIHAGFFQGHVYKGALQFDLSSVPPGSRVVQAVLGLTGLEDEYLGQEGTWQVRLLEPTIETTWAELTYETLQRAAVELTLEQELKPGDLVPSRVNRFPFGPAGLAALERRLAAGVISFRLDGPAAGPDNLFTWDSGYRGQKTPGQPPVLWIAAVLPPTPAAVVVTSTPTPENIITVAAQAAAATRVAATIGTYTPVPAYWVTPIIVTPQPTPANTATAAFLAAAATAESFLFGTPTPTPPYVWTVTPGPTSPASRPVIGTPPAAESGLSPVVVTSTPTPENIITVAAMAATATEVARTTGTYTPVPAYWVTPIIVTPQPTPANTATAAFLAAVATAENFLFGTPTPTPPYAWTVTPTPVFVLLEGELATPWATWTPTATPPAIPPVLAGKIAFLSNRSGGPEPLAEPLVYVMDPDGGNLAVLTDRAVYEAALRRDSTSADQRFRAYVKNALRFDGRRVPALYFYDALYKAEDQITRFGAGIAYEPAWSPAREQIAFTSNDSGSDEIWVINRDGSGALQLTRDEFSWWDKHPSWSPDGSQLVFWSNRTGQRQIWVMKADGSEPHNLSRTGYDDWDPVWIKYTGPVGRPALEP